MELRIIRKLIKSSYQVTLKIILNTTETAKVVRFGGPTVQIGGSFDSGGFELPSQEKIIPNEFPVVQKFDGAELGHSIASDSAIKWGDEMKVRMKNVMTEFKAIPDTFEDDSVYTV